VDVLLHFASIDSSSFLSQRIFNTYLKLVKIVLFSQQYCNAIYEFNCASWWKTGSLL